MSRRCDFSKFCADRVKQEQENEAFEGSAQAKNGDDDSVSEAASSLSQFTLFGGGRGRAASGYSPSETSTSTIRFNIGRGRGIHMRSSEDDTSSGFKNAGRGRGFDSGGDGGSSNSGQPEHLNLSSTRRDAEIRRSTPSSSNIPPLAKKKHGTSGKHLQTLSNYIMLECKDNVGIFEYEVKFNPPLDSIKERRFCLKKGEELFGNARVFNGTVLRIPQRMSNDFDQYETVDSSGNPVKVTLRYQKNVSMEECVDFYNLLFDRIFRMLEYVQVGKKMFNPRNPPVLSSEKLELWPGYVKAVERLEGGLMLTLDVSHRVLSTQTVYEKMVEIRRSNPQTFQDTLKKAFIGKIVNTKYNNKSYRVDDFLFDVSPETEFECHEQTMSVADYYLKQYKIKIQDVKQCLILSITEKRISGQKEKQVNKVWLVPELCYLTGLDDRQKKNFTLLKSMAQFTKSSPIARLNAYRQFIQNVNNSDRCVKLLDDWGLKLDETTTNVPARVLDEQKIIFGKELNKEFGVGKKADFTRAATSNEIIEPKNIRNWVLIYCKQNDKVAENFENLAITLSRPTGMQITKAKKVVLTNDKTETFCNAIRNELADNSVEIFVIVFPTLRDDRYAAVKKLLCTQEARPSQVIVAKTISHANDAKLRPIVQKIILQMNCKLGGALWGIRLPFKKTMICGIDTYHDSKGNGINVAGFIASVNDGFTKYFNEGVIQKSKEELVNGITNAMVNALSAYHKDNNCFPDSIIIYRDGVGNGQLQAVREYEISQFKKSFKKIDANYDPKLTFVVVQKRVNSKFFQEIKTAQTQYGNLEPGTVVDQKITHFDMYDFYIISQHVSEGAANPSHYLVLMDENDFTADTLQKITYKMCFMYYNWPGSVRVPATCQYAHKLADQIGTYIRQQVNKVLNDKLFFL